MDPCLVATARKNLDAALRLSETVALPDPGWRWQAYRSTALKWVNYFRTPVEAIHAIQSPRSNMGYEARMTGRQLVEYVRSTEKACQTIFPEFAGTLGSFGESPLSHPDTLTLMNGRLVSSPLYNHVIHIMRCATFVRPQRVAEIGGGYGAPGRLWMTNQLHRPDIYIDVDFPESLYFAEIYFRADDPSLRVEYIHTAGDLERALSIRDGAGTVVLVPVAQSDLLRDTPIDLLINTGSLQEMTPGYVDFYGEWIDASRAEFFYSANYFGQRIDNLLEGMNYGAPLLGRQWRTVFRGLHQDPSRPVAELLFQRDRQTQAAESSLARVRSLLTAGDPLPLPIFLELFDLTRGSADPAVLLDIVNRSAKMHYIPKESLLLATRASALAKAAAPGDAELIAKTSQMRDYLAGVAEQGRAKMGIVDGTVAQLRDRMMTCGENERAPQPKRGRLVETTEGTEIEVEGRRCPLRTGTFGSIERHEASANRITISGWSLGASPSDRVTGILFFLEGRLVETALPAMVRPEFGLGKKPIGFEIDAVLPVESVQGKHCFVVAEFGDGTVGKLVNGGDIVTCG